MFWQFELFYGSSSPYLAAMNFLAHLVLSMDDPELMIGNAIADFTRRKFYAQYPERVQKGIFLHHFIDDFTDAHPLVKEMLEAWRPSQGKYAGVVNDIVMDHFLAKDFSYHTNKNLADFSAEVYRLLNGYDAHLPERAKHTFHWMEKGDWLYNYQHLSGLERSLSGMSRRAQNTNQMAQAVNLLRRNEAFLKERFEEFYPQLNQACEDWLRS